MLIEFFKKCIDIIVSIWYNVNVAYRYYLCSETKND